tara:strand:+ start:67 stop:1788 length:1722 start_codon:yes stop_codon:yes gene_type:complete
MSSYWQSSDKIPISQKSISIPSQNGLTYSGGQRLLFDIPSSVEFIQPKESYLKWDVQLKLPSGKLPTKLQLDETLGAQSLIKDIRIYSGGAGKILLEEIQDYNVLTNIKYTYETNDVLRKKRALTEGATYHSVATRGTCGTSESHKNNVGDNPYFKPKTSATSTEFDDTDFLKVKCCLPLNTGIFSNSKVFPIMMTEGLQIDILLEDADKVMRQLDQVMRLKRHKFMPLFHSIDGDLNAPTQVANACDTKSIFLANDNMINSVKNVPFCVGEEIQFVKISDASVVVPAPVAKISSISACATNSLIQLDFSASFQTSASITTEGTFGLVSNSVEKETSYDATYTLSDCEMILQQLEMPQGYKSTMMKMMKEGGSMNYDFLSFTNYKYSQLNSDIVANIRLPLNMSRAKAILCVPTDSTVLSSEKNIVAKDTYNYFDVAGTNDNVNNSDKTGLVGVVDRLQEYQFFYDGKLNPSRKVNVSKTSTQVATSQQHIIELEKALSVSEIVPYSFLGFNENFVIGRALSLHNGVYDTRGKDFNLQVEYTGSAPQKNKLWNNFVSHLRRIEFTANGISLQV